MVTKEGVQFSHIKYSKQSSKNFWKRILSLEKNCRHKDWGGLEIGIEKHLKQRNGLGNMWIKISICLTFSVRSTVLNRLDILNLILFFSFSQGYGYCCSGNYCCSL